MRIVCAMSGGVDSSVAAALLQAQGHEVVGLTMRLYDAGVGHGQRRGGSCCSPAEVDLARDVCAQLGLPHYVVDERERFAQAVIEPFADDYAAGRTPNPCTRCNQHVKFAPLLARVRALGFDALATGHYARNEDGALLRAVDASKDQSYFLFAMGADALAHTRFPLGTWTKAEVRAHATALGLPNAAAPDSQELCFVPGDDHGEVVAARLHARAQDTAGLSPGDVVDVDGNVVGQHDGIHRVTVGQRRGLHLRGTDRRYVLRVIPSSRTVVVGTAADAATARVCVAELQRLALPDGRHRLDVQLRHRAAAAPAWVEVAGDRAVVELDAPVHGVAPGQAAVFYDGARVRGGGWITA